MFHRVLRDFALVISALALSGCGAATASTPATATASAAVADASGAAEATDDGNYTLQTQPATSPAELREGLTRTPPAIPIAQLPPPATRPAVTPSSPEAPEPPSRAAAAGEPHPAPPGVSSDPVGPSLITTLFDVDTSGDAHVRYAR